MSTPFLTFERGWGWDDWLQSSDYTTIWQGPRNKFDSLSVFHISPSKKKGGNSRLLQSHQIPKYPNHSHSQIPVESTQNKGIPRKFPWKSEIHWEIMMLNTFFMFSSRYVVNPSPHWVFPENTMVLKKTDLGRTTPLLGPTTLFPSSAQKHHEQNGTVRRFDNVPGESAFISESGDLAVRKHNKGLAKMQEL